jgi:RNA polymerase sigma-70 factor (ECF subfamily)
MVKTADLQLLDEARAGSGEALEQLLNRYEKQVYRFGLRMCGSEEDAKEVLQETLLVAFRGLRSFRGEAALSTWLFQVARTQCMRLRRKPAGAPDAFEPLEASEQQAAEGAGPDVVTQARQMGEVLQAAILVLPDAYREVLVLRDVEGLSTEAAAEVVGIGERALKSRLHRARMQLREHLATLMGESTAGSQGCPQLAEELAQEATEDVDQATCVRLDEHLAHCPLCADACDQLKRTVSLCRQIPGNEVPRPVRVAVRRAVSNALASDARLSA